MSRWRRVRVVGTIVVITGVSLAAGQTPAQRPAAGQVALPAGGFILGQVVDAGNGQGIAGVTVTLTGGSGPGAIVDERLVAQFERGLVSAEQLARGGTRRVITDAEGRFLFRDLTRGSYTATATLGGYSPGAFGRRRPEGPSRPLELADNEKVVDATIRLWKLAAISGTITDEGGEPVVGTAVLALRRYYSGGRQRIGNAITAMTDDRGVYRASSLTPGDYIIVVPFDTTTFPESAADAYRLAVDGGPTAEILWAQRQSGAPPPSSGMRVGDLVVQTGIGTNRSVAAPVLSPDGRLMVYPTSFFPGTSSLAQAAIMTVGSGEQRNGVDLMLRPIPAARVSGTVTGPGGPAANQGVRLFSADATSLTSDAGFETAIASTDTAGRFTFLGVPAGSYMLRAYRTPRPGEFFYFNQSPNVAVVSADATSARVLRPPTPPQAEPTLWAEVPVTVGDAPVVDLAVTLRPGSSVAGQIVFDGTAPRPTPQQMQQTSITIARADGRAMTTPTATPPARADAEGRFSTSGYPPGQYVLSVTSPARDWIVKSIMAGTTNVYEQPIVLDGTDLSGIVVTFTDRIAELSGSVQGIPPNTDEAFTVVLFPSDYQNWIASGMLTRRAISAPVAKAGTFQVRVPMPGEYLAAAISQDFSGDQTPAFYTTLAKAATRVTISEGERKTVSLPVRGIK